MIDSVKIKPVNFSKYEKYNIHKDCNINDIHIIQESKEFGFSIPSRVDIVYPMQSEANSNDLKKAEKGQIVYGDIIFNRSTTEFCRPDVDWRDLGSYLKEKYPSLDNVDLLCFASSTGEEAYSFVLTLKHAYGDIPIKVDASDIVQSRVDYAKEMQKNGIWLDARGFNSLYSRLGMKLDEFKKYFSAKDDTHVEIMPKILNSVEFSRKNILDSIDDFSSEKPSFIMARNMWPYVDPQFYQDFANELYEKLPSGSAIMLGGYDCDGEYGHKNADCFPSALVVAGFTPVKRGIGSICNLLNKDRILIYEKN